MAVRKALVVGIDDYPNNPLNGCCNDSAALKSLLERNGNGNPNFDVRQVNNVKSRPSSGPVSRDALVGMRMLFFSTIQAMAISTHRRLPRYAALLVSDPASLLRTS
ncbi:MAG: caspase family protein [Eggerthellaceae bacterium]